MKTYQVVTFKQIKQFFWVEPIRQTEKN